jgi:hypothetical protein
MDNTKFWESRIGKNFSDKGGWRSGEHGLTAHGGGLVHSYGYSLLDDLAGKISYFQLLGLYVKGSIIDRSLADWIESYFFGLSYPEDRIWCNLAVCLAGDMKASVEAAVSAGILAYESRAYGPGASTIIVTFITDAFKKRKRGWTVKKIIDECPVENNVPVVPGFNRPILTGDERIPMLENRRIELGIKKGPHLTLLYEIQDILAPYHEYINAGGYRSAFLTDNGFDTPELHEMLMVTVGVAGFIACYSDKINKEQGSFYPLKCEDVDYVGVEPFSLTL